MEDQVNDHLLPPRNDVQNFVTVLLSNQTPAIRKNLHCINCGRIISQYYGELRVIIIDEVREVQRPVDIQCSRCKTMFRIG